MNAAWMAAPRYRIIFDHCNPAWPSVIKGRSCLTVAADVAAGVTQSEVRLFSQALCDGERHILDNGERWPQWNIKKKNKIRSQSYLTAWRWCSNHSFFITDVPVESHFAWIPYFSLAMSNIDFHQNWIYWYCPTPNFWSTDINRYWERDRWSIIQSFVHMQSWITTLCCYKQSILLAVS